MREVTRFSRELPRELGFRKIWETRRGSPWTINEDVLEQLVEGGDIAASGDIGGDIGRDADGQTGTNGYEG